MSIKNTPAPCLKSSPQLCNDRTVSGIIDSTALVMRQMLDDAEVHAQEELEPDRVIVVKDKTANHTEGDPKCLNARVRRS